MKAIRLALDWTPNTNHIGFFVAQELGFYSEEGLEVQLLNPIDDNYAVTPAKKVEKGLAEMALCPFESIISYRIKRHPLDAVAMATIFQEDLSAIVVLKESKIMDPKDLDGRSYASYKARYEDGIVKQMIINDGGTGDVEIAYPEKLGIWETLLSKRYDATWIFQNWEGVQAKNKGIELRNFRLADYDIPYGYSPIIMTSKRKVDNDIGLYNAFLRASKRGFLYAKQNQEKAVNILRPFISESDKNIDLLMSQKDSAVAYGSDDEWGRMDKNRVNDFLDWLKQVELETQVLSYEELVYNTADF